MQMLIPFFFAFTIYGLPLFNEIQSRKSDAAI
jgi:hypothetical protein